jgi:glycosyltransferase involved in cell wall biosynthesis
MSPSIAVVMPVYNGMEFLSNSLQSVVAQTYNRWELLAFDDGSTDGSYDLLCEWSATEPRIRVFRLPENRGASAARNHAIRQARSGMIAYLDCDDEYYPDYLEQVNRLQGEAHVLVFQYDALDEDGTLLGSGKRTTWDPATVRDQLMSRNIACPLGVAHRIGLFDQVGLFNESLHILEDWDLWKRFAQAGARFLFVPHKSGLYHIHRNSQSSTGRIPEAARANSQAKAGEEQGTS